MKKFAMLICGCVALYSFYNIQSIKLTINEALNLGTLRGVENCVAYSKNDLVSIETTRDACAARIQILSFDQDLATGLAGPQIRSDKVFLEGEIENKTTEYVTTWVSLFLRVHAADGTRSDFETQTQIWIEPRSVADFDVEIPKVTPKQIEPINFCDADDDTLKPCVSWGVREIRAIKI